MSLQDLAHQELLRKVGSKDKLKLDYGLTVRNGIIQPTGETNKCTHPDADCDCTDSIDAVLSPSASDPLRRATLAALLAHGTRIVLTDDFSKSLGWLQSLDHDLVRAITLLHLEIGVDEAEQFTTDGSNYPAQWAALVGFVRDSCDLPQLTLAVDHGCCYEYYEQRNETEAGLGAVRAAYKELVKPLKELGEKGLKAFYVYLAAFHELEEEAEKAVMGKEYVAEGKISPSKRDPFYPDRERGKGEWPPFGMNLKGN